jgi:hypothetical protein
VISFNPITQRSIKKYVGIFCACSPLFGVQAFAVENTDRSALIIGIGHYNGPAADLKGVPADMVMAKEMAKAMGIPDKNITVMRDQEATKKNVLDVMKSFSNKAADGGRVFIYFSGHGTRYYNPFINNCIEGLLTYDYEVISNTELAQATKNLNKSVDKSILLVDACHSGGVVNTTKTRSALNPSYVAKFAAKDRSGSEVCTPVNYKTRSLFDETKALGAIEENVVFISSAKADEVAWDQEGLGGVATQALKKCLLGSARDLNSSGAVSLEEVRHCAQAIMNKQMPGPIQVASNISIRGNRNLIPVVNNQTPQRDDLSSTSPAPIIQPVSEVNKVTPPVESTKPIKPVENKPTKPVQIVEENQIQKPPTKPPAAQPEVNIQVASLATLQDVEAQRNPQRVIDVKLAKKYLKINKDYLDLQIKSNHDGYLYLILLGSDKKSFYVLYPNKLEQNNFIKAGQIVNLPNQSWQIKAAGPAGIDHILVMVSDSPRDLKSLEALGADPNSPFVYALNNLKGRGALIDYLTGKTPEGKSEKFAAKILTVSEVQ